MINVNLSPQRKSVVGNSARIMSIRNVINQSNATTQNLKQSEISKLKKIKGQIENVKEKAINHTDHHEILKKKLKYKLNIDTDSEDDNTSGDNSLDNSVNAKQIKENSNTNNNQKGYLDAQMTLGAEQTKAKQNTNLLFNYDAKVQIPAKVNLKKIIQTEKNPLSSPTTQQISLGHTSSLNQQPQITLANQGTSNTANPLYAQHLSDNFQVTTGTIKGLQKNSNSVVNNSYLEEGGIATEENLCYLKGLTQNQNLPNNCELTEFVENDRISIGIKTTDFFTFIRLQDEVDELRRKHQEFQLQKQLTQQQQKQQMLAISKTNIENNSSSPNHFRQLQDSKVSQNPRFNNKLNTSFGNNVGDIEQLKKEGQNIFSLYIARKVGLKWHQKMVKNLKDRTNAQSNNQSNLYQKRKSTDSNQSQRTSRDEINNDSN